MVTTTRLGPAIIRDNPFLGQTGTVPRPTTENDPSGAYPDHLARRQKWWDDAKAWADENDRIRAERLAKLEAERAAQRAIHRQEHEDAFVDGFRRTYLAADPAEIEEDFQRDLPELRRQHRIRATVAGTAAEEARTLAARRRTAAMYS